MTGAVLGDVLPLAVAVLISPIPIIAAILMLLSPNAGATSVGFMLGWLGGILIPHDKGLSGHSDADVALHAITDALLGTIGAGDIGMHFPPTDPKWRGAASAQFLQHAAGLVREQGGVIDIVDLTLICEAPRIGPHREAIRASIAAILSMPVSRVSLKATTTERLGFTGRGEGMAAQAVATVRLPE